MPKDRHPAEDSTRGPLVPPALRPSDEHIAWYEHVAGVLERTLPLPFRARVVGTEVTVTQLRADRVGTRGVLARCHSGPYAYDVGLAELQTAPEEEELAGALSVALRWMGHELRAPRSATDDPPAPGADFSDDLDAQAACTAARVAPAATPRRIPRALRAYLRRTQAASVGDAYREVPPARGADDREGCQPVASAVESAADPAPPTCVTAIAGEADEGRRPIAGAQSRR